MHQHDQPQLPQDNPAASAVSSPASEATTKHRTSVFSSLWFIAKAIEIRLRFIAVLVAIGMSIGYWDTIRNYWDKWTRPAAGAGVALSADSEFYCPMHPSVVRDKPDPNGAVPKCPICGMPLSKRKKGESAPLPDGIVSRVQLSPYRVQLAGIGTAEIEQRPLTIDLRTVGYVAIDERKLSRIVVRAAGYVEKLYVNESFVQVAAGQPLAEIYSPDLYSAAQEMLIAHSTGRNQDLVELAHEKLRLLGIAEEEIQEIMTTGKAVPRLVIRAPRGGHVFEKRIIEGDQVKVGQMLFEIADLSTVWIEADVYEKDAAMLRVGQAVEASVESYPGRVFQGRLSLVHPHMETSTRTVRVRFELDNPGHLLRPGMFAAVKLSTPVPETEPFRTLLAERKAAADAAASDDMLIAFQKLCPVTGAKLGSMGPPVRTAVHDRSLFLCCGGCEDKLAAKPDYYLSRLSRVSESGVLAVPTQAVIDTGTQKIVYVEREPGLFEGVAVTLGARSGNYYAVVDGLLPGDRVAAAGAFLVDAETRLNPAASAAYFGASGGPSSAPESVPDARSVRDAANEGPDAKALENLRKLPGPDRKLAEEQAICPITNLPLGSMGVPIKLTLKGETVFVCCGGCPGKAKDDPEGTLKRVRELRGAKGATAQAR